MSGTKQGNHEPLCEIGIMAEMLPLLTARPEPPSAAPVEPTCQHGIALDVHCCNCHSGFLFNADSCVCATYPCENCRALSEDGEQWKNLYYAEQDRVAGLSTENTRLLEALQAAEAAIPAEARGFCNTCQERQRSQP